jgi:pimeloyl-ACP methyl ester carboxylesterase
MSSSAQDTVTLRTGRRLGYASYGQPTGRPLLYFHGFPSSRLEAYPLHPIATRLNIHVLAIDRPGFGMSPHDSNRRIADWPADVAAFADHLGLDRFAVLGVSGGGPYALACAAILPPERLLAVGVLAGATAWDRGVRTPGMQWYRRLLYLAAHYCPTLLRVVSATLVAALRWLASTAWAERRIDAALQALDKAKLAREKKDDGDAAALLAKPEEQSAPVAERRGRLMGLLFEGFAQGTAGFVHETRLLTQDWGFRLEDIAYDKVQIWHGTKDSNAPVEGMREIAARIPRCDFKEYGEDHYGMGHHFEEVLGEMFPESPKSL